LVVRKRFCLLPDAEAFAHYSERSEKFKRWLSFCLSETLRYAQGGPPYWEKKHGGHGGPPYPKKSHTLRMATTAPGITKRARSMTSVPYDHF